MWFIHFVSCDLVIKIRSLDYLWILNKVSFPPFLKKKVLCVSFIKVEDVYCRKFRKHGYSQWQKIFYKKQLLTMCVCVYVCVPTHTHSLWSFTVQTSVHTTQLWTHATFQRKGKMPQMQSWEAWGISPSPWDLIKNFQHLPSFPNIFQNFYGTVLFFFFCVSHAPPPHFWREMPIVVLVCLSHQMLDVSSSYRWSAQWALIKELCLRSTTPASDLEKESLSFELMM